MAKLTDKDWLEIKTKYSLNIPLRKIADQYAISASTISRKANLEGWDKEDDPNAIDNHKLKLLKIEHSEYIKCEMKKLLIIRDIFKYQVESKKVQIIKEKVSKKGLQEKAALDTIEQLLNVKLIRQFQVGGFRIDGYDSINKIAYEIDEKQHNSKRHSQHDILRQKFIEEQLGCTFKRIKV